MKTRSIATLSVATLAFTVALAGVGTLSSANASGPLTVPAGSLTISTVNGGAGSAVYRDENGVTKGTQSFATSSKCTLSPASGTYASFAANTGVAGYASGSIGVSSANKTSGSACSQVNSDAGEALSITLSATGLGTLFGPAKASDAVFDVEVKADAWIRAELFDGGTKVGEYQLQTGSSVGKAPIGTPNLVQTCSSRSDSGPDAGSADNCRWDLAGAGNETAALFNRVVLTPLVGYFSVEGGGDWGTAASSNRTAFTLMAVAEGTLDCTTNSVATQAGDGATIGGITLTRLDNGDGSLCKALPYTLDAASGTTTFHKPDLPGQQAAQFYIQYDRTFATPSNPLPAISVDWEDGTPPLNAPFCAPGVITSVSSAGVPTVNYAAITIDQSPTNTTGTQYACVYKQSTTLNSDGSVSATDFVYFTGDIKLRSGA